MPDSVAVVILNYNGRNHLERFLPSVVKFSEPYEVVIADNASTDDSVSFLNENYPQIRLIRFEKNTGYASGYNRALAQIHTDFYVLLNSDVEVTSNWITPVIEVMKTDEKVIACQPKIKSFHKKTHFEYAGAAGGYIDYLGYPFCRGRIFNTLEEDKGQYDDTKEVFWASGACLFVKSKEFFELAAFDDQFFAHMEEIDFCWRVKNMGYKILYVGESTVYHVGGGTLNVESPFKTYLNFRNNLLMLYKNLSKVEFKTIYEQRQILNYMAAAQYFIKGKAANAKAIFKADKDFHKMKVDYEVSKQQGLTHTQIYLKSILRDYFIRGKRRWDQIKFL